MKTNQKPTASYRLDEEIIEAIDKLAKERGINKSELVREILKEYLNKR